MTTRKVSEVLAEFKKSIDHVKLEECKLLDWPVRKVEKPSGRKYEMPTIDIDEQFRESTDSLLSAAGITDYRLFKEYRF